MGQTEGVLFDTDDNVVYTVNNNGGIDALELKSGKLRWTTPENDRRFYYPIAVVGDRLVTRARVGQGKRTGAHRHRPGRAPRTARNSAYRRRWPSRPTSSHSSG